MLSIVLIRGKNHGEYYIALGREDYYLEGGEPPGRWVGEGAKTLHLVGTVKRKEFQNILLGRSSDGRSHLVQNALSKDRQIGWDLTFSAPKSVSTFWSQAEENVRCEVQAAQDCAVRKALEYLEREAAFTRRGKLGRRVEPVKLVISTFEHGTSRAQDPQLHTHGVVHNVGVREDGTTGTILSKPFYNHQMTAGALYRAELARELKLRLGLRLKKEGRWFEVEGVPKELISEFSKRRREIRRLLEGLEVVSAHGREMLALISRGKKEHIAREKLLSIWKEVGRAFGFNEKTLLYKELFSKELTPPPDLIEGALKKLTEHQAYFSKREILRVIAEETQEVGFGINALNEYLEKELQRNKEIVSLGDYRGEVRYSTKAMLVVEKELLLLAKESKKEKFLVKAHAITEAIKTRPTLGKDQKRALRHISKDSRAVRIINGMAGTGKSFVLEAAAEVYRKNGFQVLGGAPSAKASKLLSDDLGIESETLHRFISRVRRGELVPSKKSVLFLDEAGMVGTKIFHSVLSLRKQFGFRIVLVGDARQLQPVEAGGPFLALSRILGGSSLRHIRRQREKWSRDAVTLIAEGRGRKALFEFAKRGKLIVEKTPESSREKLIAAWVSHGGTFYPQRNLILAGRRVDVSDLNRKAQAERKRKGLLKGKGVHFEGKDFFVGDHIVLKENSYKLDVRNGERGVIRNLSRLGQSLTISFGEKKERVIKLSQYGAVELSYALTTHSAQGSTSENTFVLVGGALQDRELSYVQASRAKGETILFTDRFQAGDEIAKIARSFENSRQKELAKSIQQKVKLLGAHS